MTEILRRAGLSIHGGPNHCRTLLLAPDRFALLSHDDLSILIAALQELQDSMKLAKPCKTCTMLDSVETHTGQ